MAYRLGELTEFGGEFNPEDALDPHEAGGGGVYLGDYVEPYVEPKVPYSPYLGQGERLPYGNEPKYPITTGESAWAKEIRERNAATDAWIKESNKQKGRPFFVPSGRGRVPGQVWGAGGPTDGYMTAPTMGAMPTFNLPVRDEARIGSLTQKAAGPGLRELRKGMREAQGRYYENPNVRRMTLRDAMAGYGMGLEKVMGGARREARAEYEGEYAGQMTKAQLEYQGQAQQVMSQYQNAWREYLARMTG